LVNSVYFCASKLEAFHDRGRGDYLGSRDLEDVIAVVDGRQELLGELRAAESDVRSYTAHELRKLYDTREFQDALPGQFTSGCSQPRANRDGPHEARRNHCPSRGIIRRSRVRSQRLVGASVPSK